MQCCALLPATPAALGPWSDPKPRMEPLEPEGMGLQSHVLFLALPLPTNPSLPFHPAQGGRMWLLKYFKSRGSGEGQTGRESTSNPLPCQMWMLARSHKMPDGASLRQKALPSPHGSCYLLHRCGRTAIPASTALHSIAEGSPGWELDSKTHAAQTQWHLSMLWKETSESRDLPALLSLSGSYSLSSSLPPALLGPILPSPCTGRDVAMGMEKQRPFMNQFYPLPPTLVPLHEFSTKAAAAFRTARPCSISGFTQCLGPSLLHHLHTCNATWTNKMRNPLPSAKFLPAASAQRACTACSGLRSAPKSYPALALGRPGLSLSPFHLPLLLPGFKSLSWQ